MKITSVESIPVRTKRRTGAISSHILLKLQTDEGITGLGEISDLDCYRMYMPDVHAVREGLEQVLVGADPFRIEAAHQRLYSHMKAYFHAANTYPPFNPASQVAAGVDMALYDLVGKKLDTPVYNLLGGKMRDEIEITYPIFQAKQESDYERYFGYIEDAMEAGVSRFRYYVGVDLDKDEVFLKTLEEEYGDRVDLKALDFQARFHWKDARRIYERFKTFDFSLIESPCKNENYQGMSRLREQVNVDVSEHVSSSAQAMRMIEHGAVDVFNLTLQSGGIHQIQKLFHLAEIAGYKCLIGTTQELSIGTAAAAHLGAAVPELHYAGDPVGPLLYEGDVVQEPVSFQNSRMTVPEGPGLGVELDEEAVEELKGPLVEWEDPAHGADYISD